MKNRKLANVQIAKSPTGAKKSLPAFAIAPPMAHTALILSKVAHLPLHACEAVIITYYLRSVNVV